MSPRSREGTKTVSGRTEIDTDFNYDRTRKPPESVRCYDLVKIQKV